MKTIKTLLVALMLMGLAVTANAGCRTQKNAIMWTDLSRLSAIMTASKAGASQSEVATMIAADIGAGVAVLMPEGTVVNAMTAPTGFQFVVVATEDPIKLFVLLSGSLTCD